MLYQFNIFPSISIIKTAIITDPNSEISTELTTDTINSDLQRLQIQVDEQQREIDRLKGVNNEQSKIIAAGSKLQSELDAINTELDVVKRRSADLQKDKDSLQSQLAAMLQENRALFGG